MDNRITGEQKVFSDSIIVGTDANFDVYRNNLVYAFVNSQWAIFECVRAAIGDDNFRYFLKEYGTTLGVAFSDLSEAGSGLAAFLATHPKLADSKWVADIAVIEYASYQSMRRPTSIASSMACEGLVTLRLSYDVLTIYHALKNGENVPNDQEIAAGEYFYAFYVENEEVQACAINLVQFQLVEVVKNAGGIEEMIESCGEKQEVVLQNLQQLLSAGLLTLEA